MVTYEAFEELRNGVFYDYSLTDDYVAQTTADHISKQLSNGNSTMQEDEQLHSVRGSLT